MSQQFFSNGLPTTCSYHSAFYCPTCNKLTEHAQTEDHQTCTICKRKTKRLTLGRRIK